MAQEELNEVLDENMKQLQNSGYSQEYRVQILKSAFNVFQKQKEADKNGETPLYRPRGYKKTERNDQKKAKKSNWFTKDGSKSFVMVPAMPGSKLKKKIEKRLEAIKLPEKVKIVEKADPKFAQILKNTQKNRIMQ